MTPSCEQFVHNVSTALTFDVVIGGGGGPSPTDINVTDVTLSIDQERHQAIVAVIAKVVAPAICMFGIIGNAMNLIVLTRKRVQCSMDHMETSAHVGLVALALSDVFFCLFYLVALVTPIRFDQRQSNYMSTTAAHSLGLG